MICKLELCDEEVTNPRSVYCSVECINNARIDYAYKYYRERRKVTSENETVRKRNQQK